MKTIAAADANRQFSKILREVRAGETYTVTSRGEPVAVIQSPVSECERQNDALRKYLHEASKRPALNLGRFTRADAYDD